jgi:periplasmic protein TonB
MPAYASHRGLVRPRERVTALAAVVLVQTALAFVLLSGLRVDIRRPVDVVQRLIEITLAKPPPPAPPVESRRQTEKRQSAAPKARPEKLGGSPGPKPAHAPPSVKPVVAVQPSAAPSGGGSGTGPASGAGAGGGSGGEGYGAGGGGSDLEQIAGEITPRDYPRRLAGAGVGGVVGILFRVEPTGLVSRCSITRSSGVPELDALTCRLIVQRFRYRPSTDRYGRPIADNVEGEHEWIPHR